MILPQQDQTQHNVHYHYQPHPYNLTHLTNTYSPTLPLHFDKSYLPKDLCQKELVGLSQCLLLYNNNESTLTQICNLQVSKFINCKKKRDLRILDGIQKWEKQHLKALDQNNRELYLRGLGFKLERLKNDYGRQPSTVAGINRISQLEPQIKQLKWRINYLNELKQQLQ